MTYRTPIPSYSDHREDLNDEISAFIQQQAVMPEKKATMSVTTKIITVTPVDAEKYLKNMVNNRPRREKRITFYASAMRRGEWALSGQPVIFSGPTTQSKLLDGQHRMLAIKASGCTVPLLAVFGVGEEMFTKLDQGAARSAGDCLMVANRIPVATAVKYLFFESRVKHGAVFQLGNHIATNEQIVEIYNANIGVAEAASAIAGLKRVRKMIGHGVAAYCMYRMRADNALEADRFFAKLNSGEGLPARSPILSLRNQLIDGTKKDKIVSRWDVNQIIYGIARAWSMTLDGKSGAVSIANAVKEWAGWRTTL